MPIVRAIHEFSNRHGAILGGKETLDPDVLGVRRVT